SRTDRFRGLPGTLPYDRIVEWRTVAPVPDNGGLALVGEADGEGLPPPFPQLLQDLAAGRKSGGPEDLGVVLHPPGSRVDLLERLLRLRQHLPGAVEADRPR